MTKPIVFLLLACLLAGLGWHFRGSLGWPGASPDGSAASLRKCVAGDGRVLYTQDACPPGSRGQAVAAGSVTVLPAAPAPPAAGASSGLPTVRDALLGPGPQPHELKDRQMDRVIGR